MKIFKKHIIPPPFNIEDRICKNVTMLLIKYLCRSLSLPTFVLTLCNQLFCRSWCHFFKHGTYQILGGHSAFVSSESFAVGNKGVHFTLLIKPGRFVQAWWVTCERNHTPVPWYSHQYPRGRVSCGKQPELRFTCLLWYLSESPCFMSSHQALMWQLAK